MSSRTTTWSSSAPRSDAAAARSRGRDRRALAVREVPERDRALGDGVRQLAPGVDELVELLVQGPEQRPGHAPVQLLAEQRRGRSARPASPAAGCRPRRADALRGREDAACVVDAMSLSWSRVALSTGGASRCDKRQLSDPVRENADVTDSNRGLRRREATRQGGAALRRCRATSRAGGSRRRPTAAGCPTSTSRRRRTAGAGSGSSSSCCWRSTGCPCCCSSRPRQPRVKVPFSPYFLDQLDGGPGEVDLVQERHDPGHVQDQGPLPAERPERDADRRCSRPRSRRSGTATS